MVKYHNALDAAGHVIDISDVTEENRAKYYICVGCGKKMSAALGKKQEHHFRHKGDSCSWESYLHKLAKRKLKERFDTQKEFTVCYYMKPCEKAAGCKLANFFHCDKRKLCDVDLKKRYDTCEEEVLYKGFRADLMLSHSEHPEREPIFLEISVAHDNEPEKLASGIKIIELKIKEEKDVLQPLVEDESSIADLALQNPYDEHSMPPVRFFNFERELAPQCQLPRFWLSKDENGLLQGYAAWDGLDCKNVDHNHREDSIFEVAIPILNPDVNVFDFGMMRALKRGLVSSSVNRQYQNYITSTFELRYREFIYRNLYWEWKKED